MDRVIRWVETFAGLSLFVIAFATFANVILRKFFNYSPPDVFDGMQLLLGISVFWGIASACYHNGHILVDILYEFANAKWRRAIDLAATSLLLVFMIILLVTLADGIRGTAEGNVRTMELKLMVWPFHLIACMGILAACVMTGLRLWEVACGRARDSATSGG